MKRVFIALLACTLCVPGLTAILGGEEPADAKVQKLSEESRARAERIQVQVATGSQVTRATIRPNPLMKYTDVPRQIEMATLWVWHDEGRPVALVKVEAYQRKEGSKWLYCFASASTGLVDGKWHEGRGFHASKPGIDWTAIKGPAPQAHAAGRLRQLKELFQRFSATVRDDLLKTSDELRPLARPLHEYSSPKHGVVQGILCGFAANGTNPDVVIALEAVSATDDKDRPKSWRYGVVCMTATGVSVKLDKAEVFTRPYVGSPGDYDTWTWFWEGTSVKREDK
jgi:hypothetical protein